MGRESAAETQRQRLIPGRRGGTMEWEEGEDVGFLTGMRRRGGFNRNVDVESPAGLNYKKKTTYDSPASTSEPAEQEKEEEEEELGF
ncbi:hypothetical protein MY11210_000912 [Beauveria gryllotalpidicola]